MISTDLGELILVFDIQCVLSELQQLFCTLQCISALRQLVLIAKTNTKTLCGINMTKLILFLAQI